MAEEDLLHALRARLGGSAFHTWAGMEVVEAAPGEVTVAMTVEERHLNLQGFVHGGMLSILADTACGLSIRSAMEPGRLHVTADLDISTSSRRRVPAGCSDAAPRSRSVGRSPSPRRRSRTTTASSWRERSPASP